MATIGNRPGVDPASPGPRGTFGPRRGQSKGLQFAAVCVATETTNLVCSYGSISALADEAGERLRRLEQARRLRPRPALNKVSVKTIRRLAYGHITRPRYPLLTEVLADMAGLTPAELLAPCPAHARCASCAPVPERR